MRRGENQPRSKQQQASTAGVGILDELLRLMALFGRQRQRVSGVVGLLPAGNSNVAGFRLFRVDRSLELHFRHSLGLVTYRVGRISLAHEDYMWAVVGQRSATHYPGFSTDPLD